MKFTKIKKREIYETWQNKNRKYGITSYIHLTTANKLNDTDRYHFCVSCNPKRCKREECIKDDCEKRIRYSSLNDMIIFSNFEECEKALAKWVYKHR